MPFSLSLLLCNNLQGFFLGFSPLTHTKVLLLGENISWSCVVFSSLIKLPNSCSASGIVSFSIGAVFVQPSTVKRPVHVLF